MKRHVITTQSDQIEPISDLLESTSIQHTICLNHEHWQNIPENRLPWFEYNHDSRNRKKVISTQQMIIPCIEKIIRLKLTSRQKQVIMMYYYDDLTQVVIASKLGISQATVSQHLAGKKRQGKKIGGSIRKIQKMIHFMSRHHNHSHNESAVLSFLGQLLDKNITRRRSSVLFRLLFK